MYQKINTFHKLLNIRDGSVIKVKEKLMINGRKSERKRRKEGMKEREGRKERRKEGRKSSIFTRCKDTNKK